MTRLHVRAWLIENKMFSKDFDKLSSEQFELWYNTCFRYYKGVEEFKFPY